LGLIPAWALIITAPKLMAGIGGVEYRVYSFSERKRRSSVE
jgi:hypothetical protein